MAGIQNVGEFMNLNRLRSMEGGLNGQTRKVYDLVPIESTVVIADVMYRLAEKGSRPEKKVVEACLRDLVDQGLLKQPSPGHFQRVPVPRLEVVKPASGGVPTEPARDLSQQKRSPFDEIAEIDRRLSALIECISIISKEASAIGEMAAAAAVHVEDHIQSIRKEYAKLDALKSLLKDL